MQAVNLADDPQQLITDFHENALRIVLVRERVSRLFEPVAVRFGGTIYVTVRHKELYTALQHGEMQEPLTYGRLDKHEKVNFSGPVGNQYRKFIENADTLIELGVAEAGWTGLSDGTIKSWPDAEIVLFMSGIALHAQSPFCTKAFPAQSVNPDSFQALSKSD